MFYFRDMHHVISLGFFESLMKCQTDKCGICGDDLSYMKE